MCFAANKNIPQDQACIRAHGPIPPRLGRLANVPPGHCSCSAHPSRLYSGAVPSG